MAHPTKTGRPEPGMLAEAMADYRRSVALLEKLLVDSPETRKFAATWPSARSACHGLLLPPGFRIDEAEAALPPLDRDQARVASRHVHRPTAIRVDTADEFEDLSDLVTTVHILAGMLDGKGKVAEAEAMRRNSKMTSQWSPRGCQGLNSNSGGRLGRTARAAVPLRLIQCERPSECDDQSPAGNDPRSRECLALNNLAWSLASVPSDPWFERTEGLALARKAVALEPNEWAT